MKRPLPNMPADTDRPRHRLSISSLVMWIAAVTMPLITSAAEADNSSVLNSILGRDQENLPSHASEVSRKDLLEAGTQSTTLIFSFSGEEYIGHGSGFFVSQTLIVTNAHVVEGADYFQIVTPGGENVEAEVMALGSSEGGVDIAVLEIPENERMNPVVFSSNYEALAPVFAFGYPGAALDGTVTWSSLMSGDWLVDPEVVASKGNIHLVTRNQKNVEVIVHSAKISPGSSGGPLFDQCSNVIGINTYGTLNPSEVVSENRNEGNEDQDDVEYVLVDAGYHFSISGKEILDFLERRNIETELTDPGVVCGVE